MSYRRRTDIPHAEIAETLRRCGWQVLSTHTLPGFVDLVIWKHDQPESVRLVEVKTPKVGRRTKAQQQLALRGCPIVTITTAEQAARVR